MSNFSAAAAAAAAAAAPSIVYFGMRCAFSAPPLAALIASGLPIRAVVLPAPRGSPPARFKPSAPVVRLPVAGSLPGVEELAERAGIPILEIADARSPEVLAAVRALDADALAVACFPWRLPAALRAIPRLGAINLHPSLLPRWRGPEPLFWTFKTGDAESGVSVHLMDDGFDTGPLLLQARIPVPPGAHGLAFERELAALGGRLLVDAIEGLAAGTITPQAQDESLATRAPIPDDEDVVIDSDLPAARIVDLVRGIVPLWGPLTLRIARKDAEFSVNGVVSFDPAGTMPEPFVTSALTVRVRCRPGVASLTFSTPPATQNR